jgi:hypothetical protein
MFSDIEVRIIAMFSDIEVRIIAINHDNSLCGKILLQHVSAHV